MKSIRSEAVLELGIRLVKELGSETHADTLSRWMAHYIAELIHDVEAATGDNRPVLMKQCEEAILRLWSHRHKFPNGENPLTSLEEIESVLQSLDAYNTSPRYFTEVWGAKNKDEENSDETKKWLSLAKNFDNSAKMMIRYALTKGAEASIDKSRPWIQLLDAIDGSSESIQIVFQTFKNELDTLGGKSETEYAKNELQTRIQKLDAFIKLANVMEAEFKTSLAKYDEKTSQDERPVTEDL